MYEDQIEVFIRRIKIASLSKQLEELLTEEATSLQASVVQLKGQNFMLRMEIQQLTQIYTSIVN
jgi:hypothetical protein